MEKKDVEAFCDYVVYEISKGKVHYLCCTKEYKVAEAITYLLAKNDPDGDSYHFTNVDIPNTFVIGGGWSVTYQKADDGTVRRFEIS